MVKVARLASRSRSRESDPRLCDPWASALSEHVTFILIVEVSSLYESSVKGLNALQFWTASYLSTLKTQLIMLWGREVGTSLQRGCGRKVMKGPQTQNILRGKASQSSACTFRDAERSLEEAGNGVSVQVRTLQGEAGCLVHAQESAFSIV